eukprot:12046779-Alexandrium_andersonii.AAC.1
MSEPQTERSPIAGLCWSGSRTVLCGFWADSPKIMACCLCVLWRGVARTNHKRPPPTAALSHTRTPPTCTFQN